MMDEQAAHKTVKLRFLIKIERYEDIESWFDQNQIDISLNSRGERDDGHEFVKKIVDLLR